MNKNCFKRLLTIVLVSISFVFVSYSQEQTTYLKIDAASVYDEDIGGWSEGKLVNGILTTQGNKVRIQVEEPTLDLKLELIFLDKAENDEVILTKYRDVKGDITVWYHFNKKTNSITLRLITSETAVQFRIVTY